MQAIEWPQGSWNLQYDTINEYISIGLDKYVYQSS